MEEQIHKGVRPLNHLTGATIFFYGSLVLFLRFGEDISTSSLYPFIRVGCKWTLFAWMVYGGVMIGEKLSAPIIKSLRSKIQELEDHLLRLEEEKLLLKEELLKLQESHAKDLSDQKSIESSLRAKLKKFERTPAESNRLAMKDFL